MPTPLLPSDNNTERAFGPYGIPEGALASPPQNGPGSSLQIPGPFALRERRRP